jgi:hypothetical protein
VGLTALQSGVYCSASPGNPTGLAGSMLSPGLSPVTPPFLKTASPEASGVVLQLNLSTDKFGSLFRAFHCLPEQLLLLELLDYLGTIHKEG